MTFVFTGSGNVSQGAQEIFQVEFSIFIFTRTKKEFYENGKNAGGHQKMSSILADQERLRI